jgi:hypothetical protein
VALVALEPECAQSRARAVPAEFPAVVRVFGAVRLQAFLALQWSLGFPQATLDALGSLRLSCSIDGLAGCAVWILMTIPLAPCVALAQTVLCFARCLVTRILQALPELWVAAWGVWRAGRCGTRGMRCGRGRGVCRVAFVGLIRARGSGRFAVLRGGQAGHGHESHERPVKRPLNHGTKMPLADL